MANIYDIVSDGVRVEEIISQLRAIKTYPASVKIYDRALLLSTETETHVMIHGLEIGSYITKDEYDAHIAHSK